MNQSSKSILIFVSGVATGAAIGILFAPDSGKNVRDKIRYRLEKQWEKLRDRLNGNDPDESLNFRSELRDEDYHKAEGLLNEVEGLLDEIKGKGKS